MQCAYQRMPTAEVLKILVERYALAVPDRPVMVGRTWQVPGVCIRDAKLAAAGLFVVLALLGATLCPSSIMYASWRFQAYVTAIVLLALAYAFIYCLYRGAFKRTVLIGLLAAVCLLFSADIVDAYVGLGALLFGAGSLVTYLDFFFTAFAPFILIVFGIYVYKSRPFGGISGYIALAFAVAGAALFIVIITSGGGVALDDEEFIANGSLQAVLSGRNPYLIDFGPSEFAAIMGNSTGFGGVTFNSDNTLAAVLNHPFLYVVSFLPGYMAASLYSNSTYVYIEVLTIIYFLLLIVVFGLASGADSLKRPKLVAVVFIALFALVEFSPVQFLLLSVLLLAYMARRSWYLFLFLGIAASLQELLWIPVLLFLVYRFNNYGPRSGALTLAGVALIFVIVNGYFIAASPAAFFGNILSTLSTGSHMLSVSQGPFEYLFYMVPFSYSNIAFYLAIPAVALLMALFNDIRLAGPLSMLPFLFMYIVLAGYFILFITFFVLILLAGGTKERRAGGRFNAALRGKGRLVVAIAIAVLAVSAIAFLYLGSRAYAANFRLDVANATLAEVNGNTVYSGRLSYAVNGSIDVYFIAFSSPASAYGLLNRTILEGGGAPYNPADYSTMINRNRLAISGSGSADFSLMVNGSAGGYLSCLIYDADYYYICPVATYANRRTG